MIVLLLFLAGLALLFCELFIPGGILGSVGLLSIGGSIFLAFRDYSDMAWAVLAGELLIVGVGAVVALRVFPHTPIGRRLTLRREFDANEGFTSASSGLEDLAGKEGIAITTLRPAGIALIDGERMNVVTDGEFIEKDSHLIVAEVEGSRVVVRPMNEEDAKA